MIEFPEPLIIVASSLDYIALHENGRFTLENGTDVTTDLNAKRRDGSHRFLDVSTSHDGVEDKFVYVYDMI